MELIWYGTASLVLREEGTVITFDPFGKLPIHGFSGKLQHIPHEKEYREATDVFVTHGHFDHIYHIPHIYREGKVRIYCTEAPMRTLEKHGIPDMEIVCIAPGWSGEVGPFQIEAWQGRHCKFDLPLVLDILRRPLAWRHFFYSMHLATMSLSYPEKREILFYEVSLKKKVPGQEQSSNKTFRVQIMGSMNLDPDTIYPTGADVLILPLQGRSDQDEYALQFVERLKPKQVLLDHYDNAFPPISQDVDVSGFVKNVEERLHIPCRPMKEGEILSWKSE